VVFSLIFFIARDWLSFFLGGGVIIARDKIIDPIYILELYYSKAYFYAYLMPYAALSVKYEQMTFPVFLLFFFFLKRFSPRYLVPTSALCTSSLGTINSMRSLPSSKFMTATQEGSVERQPTAYTRRKKALVSGRFILSQ